MQCDSVDQRKYTILTMLPFLLHNYGYTYLSWVAAESSWSRCKGAHKGPLKVTAYERENVKFLFHSHFLIWSKHSNWQVSLHKPASVTHAFMSKHSEFSFRKHTAYRIIHSYLHIKRHTFSIIEFCVKLSLAHFPFHPYHPWHKQNIVSIQLTIHSSCLGQHQ